MGGFPNSHEVFYELTKEQIEAALAYATELVANTEVLPLSCLGAELPSRWKLAPIVQPISGT